jgi:hypothetical protein
MKKGKNNMRENELRPEYDLSNLSGAVRGKYAERYQAGTNLVHLDPDVAAVFKDEGSVNKALRSLIELAKAQVG